MRHLYTRETIWRREVTDVKRWKWLKMDKLTTFWTAEQIEAYKSHQNFVFSEVFRLSDVAKS